MSVSCPKDRFWVERHFNCFAGNHEPLCSQLEAFLDRHVQGCMLLKTSSNIYFTGTVGNWRLLVWGWETSGENALYYLQAFDVALLATWAVELMLDFETRQRINGLNLQFYVKTYLWGLFYGPLTTGGFT